MLEIAGLEAGYGPNPVLFGVDLAIGEGEFGTLLGRNGMGKTTTIRALMGLITPRGGSIRFRGEAIAAIGVAAILPRIPRARVAELADALDRERRRIESRLLSGMGSGDADADSSALRVRPVRAAA